MKILFSHLSDLHIEKASDIKVINVKKIVDALHVIKKFERVIIIVSGDIDYREKSSQYISAYKMFGTIISKIKEKKWSYLCLENLYYYKKKDYIAKYRNT